MSDGWIVNIFTRARVKCFASKNISFSVQKNISDLRDMSRNYSQWLRDFGSVKRFINWDIFSRVVLQRCEKWNIFLVTMSSSVCCVTGDNGVEHYAADQVPPNCTLLTNELDLVSMFQDTDTIMTWYQLCFGPREPPPISWQELIIPLLVYRSVKYHSFQNCQAKVKSQSKSRVCRTYRLDFP